MAREDPETTKKRDQLRRDMLADGRTYEQIAAAMVEECGDRRRVAWRNAHGWTQKDVAALYNEEVNDPNASMTPQRISDYERWPIKGGSKPASETLDILAGIYGTTRSNLVDDHDRQKMTLRELASLESLDKQTSISKTHLTSRPLAYAENVEIPHQLPNAVPYFVGRNHELEKLTAQLNNATVDGSPVVITAIGGTAGIGKTALAVHWAQTHSDWFPDGQLYVNLRGFHPSGTPMPPQEAIRGFLDAFQVPVEKIPTSLDAQAALYRKLVEGKHLVLVLDNACDADQVRPLLPDSPTCMVLVTSRQQLSSLAYEGATYITLGFLSTGEAHELLIKVLGSERINAEPEAVEELIQRCVHLPTALHIAAARIKTELHTSLSVLVGQLQEQRQQLAALSTGDSIYFDIRAVFSWSYTALSPQAARLFRLLGLHPGPDLNPLAAASLAGLPEHYTHELLRELLRASLLEEPIAGRYQFHDLLSAYATEQAHTEEAEPHQQAAQHRVLDHYLYTGFVANRHLAPTTRLSAILDPQPGVILHQVTDYEQALEWFTAEHAVLLSAIAHAGRGGFDTHAYRLPRILAAFLNRRGHWHDYVATQQISLAAAERLQDHGAQAEAFRLLGHAHIRLGCFTDAFANLQQALVLFEELGDRDGQALTHHALGLVYERQGQHTEALAHAQRALDLYRITDNRRAHTLSNLGWYCALLGQYQQTLTYCQQALDLHRELGDQVGVAETLDSLGYAYHHLGYHDQAITHYQQALTLHRELGYSYGEAEALTHLGETHYATVNVAAARDVWQQALAIFNQLGHADADAVRAKLAALNTGPDE